MKNRLVILLMGFCLSASFGQNKIQEVACGDKVESAFTVGREWQSFQINLDGGDNLKVYASSKFGDHLKFNLQLWAPAQILMQDTRNLKSIHQIESDILPGSGTYAVNPYNFPHNQGYGGHLGDYIIEFVCEKANGEVISPDNKSNSGKQEIIPEKAQFLSIPFGTPIEGEITSGSNQLFGFKTKIEKNFKVAFKFSIIQGNTPVEIQILDPVDKSIIFYSTFGYASSMETIINFPNTREYLISIKESSNHKGSGLTKFKISFN